MPHHVIWRGSHAHFLAWIDGQRVRKALGTTDPDEAERRATMLYNALRNRLTAPVTVGSFADTWLDDLVAVRRNEKGATLARQRFRDHVRPVIGDRPLRDLHAGDLLRLRAELSRKLAPQSVLHVLSDVRSLLRHAADCGEIGASPWRRGILPKIAEAAPRRLGDAQVSRILTASSPGQRWVIAFLLETGLRWSELRALEPRHICELPYRHLVIERAKSGKVRRVPLSDEAWRMAQERVDAEYLSPLRPGNACWIYRDVGARAGLAWHMHQLRHTFACRWLERGGSLQSLQQILGHSTPTMTQRYARMSDQSVAREMASLEVKCRRIRRNTA